MSEQISKTSEISIQVGLNENLLPLRMLWSASDGQIKDAEAAAFLLSIWDPKEKNTMKIDLWTKDMTIEEMKQFFKTANTPIIGIDNKGLVNEWNLTSEKITGYTKQEVLGKNFVETYIAKEYKKIAREGGDVSGIIGRLEEASEFIKG